MAAKVPQTLEYRGGHLNVALVLEVENFTNWKKRFMCHIIGIESQFENIIKNGPYIPMTAGQRKPEVQWTPVERKAANLDQRLKSLIMFVLPDDQMNSAINCLTAKSIWDDLILYHEGPFDVKESKIVDLKLCYNTFKFKEGETLTQTFTRYKDLMNELVNDDIKLSKLEINTGFINGLPKKWISFCQTLRNTNHAKDSELASLFASKASMVKNKGLIAKSYEWDKEEVSSDDNEMVEVKVHMALAEDNEVVRKEGAKNEEWVKISMSKVHTLLEMEDNDDRKNYLDYLCIDLNYIEEQRNNLLSKHRNLVQELNTCKEQPLVLKQAKLDFLTIQHRILGVDQLTKDLSSSGQKDLVFIKSLADDTKVSILGVERPWLSEDEGFILPNHDTGRILLTETQRNITNPLVVVTDSLATDYDSADESLVCSIPLPLLKKLDGAEPVSGPKTIKLILRSKSAFKAYEKTGHRTCDHAEYMSTSNTSKHVKNQGGYSLRSRTPRPSKHFFPPCIHCGFCDHLSDDCVNYPICDICGSYDHDTHGHNRIVSLRRGIKPRNPQHVMKSYETCGSTVHTTTDHNDIEWFRKGEALQAKKCNIRKPIWYLDSRCSRHITGVKSYLHKYVEHPRPKVVFRDDSTCTTKGYSSIRCNGIFDEKRGTILNSNKEVVMITPRVRDVYILDMTSYAQESCFFAKSSENLNWLWHKRLAHLNFKTINSLAKQNLVTGLPSLVYSKDKPCSSCEKGKHHRANFKTKQTFSINKCLHLLHMDLFGPVTPRSINHEKYTLVIVDEYSRNFLKNSSPYTPEQNGVAERKNITLIEGARTMLLGIVFSKQYWNEAIATACYTQNRSTIVKRHLKTPYEIFRKHILNIDFLHVFGCRVFFYNHKDHLGKFDGKAVDGYFLGYSLVSKAFRVFNTRRQQTEETYHITFDESPNAIKFTKPSVDNINIAKSERYPLDKYLHPYEPS
ncbi:retrovirus-related pol polyprotein from transposon TNT 1-94 [Tanacetum coccineum]